MDGFSMPCMVTLGMPTDFIFEMLMCSLGDHCSFSAAPPFSSIRLNPITQKIEMLVPEYRVSSRGRDAYGRVSHLGTTFGFAWREVPVRGSYWLDDLSNFAAGAGDFLTAFCGWGRDDWASCTQLEREKRGIDVVNPNTRAYGLGQDTGATILALFGSQAFVGTRFGFHGPHHGQYPHFQVNIWLRGVKGSGFAGRVPWWKP